MPRAYGLKARTRSVFARPFRRHGMDPLSRLLITYRIGDYVDIVVDGSKPLGQPFKYYHGKTGKVFDVCKRAVGVIVNKRVRNKILPKRIHVRVEHIRKSRCREGFIKRINDNDMAKNLAKKAGQKLSTKRVMPGPAESHVVEPALTKIDFLNPLPYASLY